MTAQPDMPGPDTGSYEVIHLGGQATVVVPVTDFLRLRVQEQAAAPHELEDAEDTAAVLEWKVRDFSGQTTFVSADEARRHERTGARELLANSAGAREEKHLAPRVQPCAGSAGRVGSTGLSPGKGRIIGII